MTASLHPARRALGKPGTHVGLTACCGPLNGSDSTACPGGGGSLRPGATTPPTTWAPHLPTQAPPLWQARLFPRLRPLTSPGGGTEQANYCASALPTPPRAVLGAQAQKHCFALRSRPPPRHGRPERMRAPFPSRCAGVEGSRRPRISPRSRAGRMRFALVAAFSVSYGRRSRSEPGGARAVLGTRGRSRWAAATGFLSGAAAAAAAAGVAPAEPLLRPPPQRGPGAAMPSDFISLLSADLDLESPKSLYSKGESAAEAAQGLLRSRRRSGRIAGGRAVGASQQAVACEPRRPRGPASREQPGPGGCGCAEASLGAAGGASEGRSPLPRKPPRGGGGARKGGPEAKRGLAVGGRASRRAFLPRRKDAPGRWWVALAEPSPGRKRGWAPKRRQRPR